MTDKTPTVENGVPEACNSRACIEPPVQWLCLSHVLHDGDVQFAVRQRSTKTVTGADVPEETEPMLERRIVRFFGWVQGVGFRYTVERIARRFPQVAGQVYNEDNHVTVDIEGTAAEIAVFIDEIIEHAPHSARIESTESVSAPITGCHGFQIGRTR